MKKVKKLILFILLLIPFNTKAVSISSMNCSPGSVTSGDEFTASITINLDEEGYIQKSSGMISSSNLRSTGGDDSYFSDSASSSITLSHSFKALDPGTGTIYFTANVSDYLGDNEREVSASCSISVNERIIESPSSNTGYNSNNDSNTQNNTVNKTGSGDSTLKKLGTNKGKLNPEFNPELFDYSIAVSNDVDKISIEGEANNENSEVLGLGEKELQEGINKFEIVVTAENGESRIYTIEVTRKEKDSIEIIIDKKKYTVIKKEGILNPPKGFIKTNVVIDKQDVIAYSNEYTGYMIVGLINEEGKAGWYIYNSKNSSYIKYNEVTSKNLRLIILDAPKSKIPSGYVKTKLDLDALKVTGYYIKGIKDFKLVYAVNIDNGKKSFYQYDAMENTFQRYNEKMIAANSDFEKKLEIALVGAVALILIMFIFMISLISSKNNIKKNIRNIKEEHAIDKIVKEEKRKKQEKEEIDEDSNEEPEVEIEEEKYENPLTKKELKRLKKEEKKRLKKEQEDFLR